MRNMLWLAGVLVVYILMVFVFSPGTLHNSFDTGLIDRYLCSQDIPTEPPCKRLFLSDSEIHIAAGYLYTEGANPTQYNFQHPPFIKYLYGYSIQLFGNPYIAQMFLGALLLIATFVLGLLTFKRAEIAAAGSLLLIFDPLFRSMIASALLDLGQAVFLLGYIISMLYFPRRYIVQGIMLGLLVTSKFWGGSIFFVGVIFLYLAYKKKLNLKRYFSHLGIAAIIFLLVYVKAFMDVAGSFNIVFFELRTIKYWLDHSTASVFGSSLFLFLTGYFKEWWGTGDQLSRDTWTLLWPVMYVIGLVKFAKGVKNRVFNNEHFLAMIATIYLIYLAYQAPFTRYFILVLPIFYLLFAKILFEVTKTKLSK